MFSNNRSVRDSKEFVTSEVLKLLELGCIREVNCSEVHTINSLSAADNDKKLRLILDLRYINQHFRVPKMKNEDMRTFGNLVEKGDFEIRLSPPGHSRESPKILSFSWIIDGKERGFVFTVLVFGQQVLHLFLLQLLEC